MSKKAKASKLGGTSMDIREMFKQQPSKKPPQPATATKGKAAVIIEEDEDFKPARPIGGTRGKPQVQKGKAVPGTSPGGQRTKRARAVIKDDSEDEIETKKTNKSDTPPKDDPCPKPAENRKQVQTLSGLFGSAPIRRSETPADKKKQLSSKTHQGAVSPPDLLLEDMISLEDFQSNSQDAEMCKEINTHTDKDFQKTIQEMTQKRPSPFDQETPSKRLKLQVKRVSTEGIATPPSSQKAQPAESSSPVSTTPTASRASPTSIQSSIQGEPCVASKTVPLSKESHPAPKKSVKRAIAYLDEEGEISSGKKKEEEVGPKGNSAESMDALETKPVVLAPPDETEVVPVREGVGAMLSPQKSRLEAGYRIPKLSVSPSGAKVVIRREKPMATTKPALLADSPQQSKPSEGKMSSASSGGKSDQSSPSSTISTPTGRGKTAQTRGTTSSLFGKPTKQLFTSPKKPAKSYVEPTSKKSPGQDKLAKPVSDVAKLVRGSSYHMYRSRGGPRAPGSKPIPEGKEDCLEGLTFVITGVLESLEREEATDLVRKYGGKVTQSISKNTSYVVVGEGAGQSKLVKATECGTKQIDEDGLLELIRTREKGPVVPVTPKIITSRPKKGAKKSPPDSGSPTVGTPSQVPSTPSQAPSTPSQGVSTTPVQTPLQNATALAAGTENLMWVDRYRPKTSKNIIGQQGDKSCAKKLAKWLQDWQRNRTLPAGKESSETGASFRAALLSGPPGIGKTTTATIVCEECGYTYFELNASSTRSSRSLQAEVASQLGSHSLDGFVAGEGGGALVSGRKHALIMDEVDGMAGNEDRGGIQELIALIKSTKVPIICICNDRVLPKIRSLANYCYDLRFPRPKVEQIKGAIMSVAFKEKVKIPPQALEQLIVASGHDIRQVLHNLSLWSVAEKSLNYEQAKGAASGAKKNITIGPFDVIRTVFMPMDDGRELSFGEKTELFFHDYNIAALFVQENYPLVKPVDRGVNMKTVLHRLSQAADSLSDGNLVERQIRGTATWGLLPTQAVFSSVIPGECMRGYLGQPHFPMWLGNNSKKTKCDRLLQQLWKHTSLRNGGRGSITEDLLEEGVEEDEEESRALMEEEEGDGEEISDDPMIKVTTSTMKTKQRVGNGGGDKVKRTAKKRKQ
eukprot:Em0005g1323a